MQAGDLVFISGTYVNPEARAQVHDMVHVEVWMGDGDKTLGARWQTGVVEVHQSYQFVAKSYTNMTYHFRSIDTWLQGVCRRCDRSCQLRVCVDVCIHHCALYTA